MYSNERNEAKRLSVLIKALFLVLIPPATHFGQILSEKCTENLAV
jgi:hypothetical protein